MKTLLALILLISAGTVYLIHSYEISPITEIVVPRDITDSLQAQPQADEILSLYGFERSKWGGAVFRFVDLSDVSFNHASEVKLAPANQWLSNEPEREKEIQKFKEGITKILSVKSAIGKTHSSLYLPLAMELNRLSQSKADRKVFIVYSDLMENTPAVSFYDSKTFMELQSNSEALTKLFEKEQLLNSLTGIEVHLLFQPKDTLQDEQFKVVSEFYQKLLESKGAQVTIGANL
jgi:hypothetical protein